MVKTSKKATENWVQIGLCQFLVALLRPEGLTVKELTLRNWAPVAEVDGVRDREGSGRWSHTGLDREHHLVMDMASSCILQLAEGNLAWCAKWSCTNREQVGGQRGLVGVGTSCSLKA